MPPLMHRRGRPRGPAKPSPPAKTVIQKPSAHIIEVLFKNVFLKGSLAALLHPALRTSRNAPKSLWQVIIDGAEQERRIGYTPLPGVRGHDVVMLLRDSFRHYAVRPETRRIVEWNFGYVWGFPVGEWDSGRVGAGLRAYRIEDVSYVELLEIGTLAFGDVDQKMEMGFR